MKKLIFALFSAILVAVLLPMAVFAADLPKTEAQTTEKDDCVYYVIDPDCFTLGGWKLGNDAQGSFRSTFMYDQGDGREAATARLVVPKDGTYRVWVHAKDSATDRPGIRNAEIAIDGTVIGKAGNHGLEGWAWQSYDVTLLGGEHTLSALDANKWARFDLVLVTDDLDYIPSNTEKDLKALDDRVYDPSVIEWVTKDPLEGRPETEIAVKFNDDWLTFDVEPQLMNDRTMVPMRAIFEALGATVSWDDASAMATGVRNGKTVSVTIGSNVALINGNMVSIDQSAALVNDRTLVPLRFISEAFGASVSWDDASQTVFIEATVMKNGIYIGGTSYMEYGTWSVYGTNDDGSVYLIGTTPEPRADGKDTTVDDADASQNKPAIAEFTVEKEGTYKLWVYARDFSTNQQGTRYFNVAVNGTMDSKTFGKHAGDGFKWEEAGTYTLKAGKNTVEVYDTSGFYARVAGIFLAEDMDFVPPEDHKTLAALYPVLDPAASMTTAVYPTWAEADLPALDMTYIETETTRVNFYTVSDGTHSFVQTEMFAKDENGAWVSVKGKTDAYGYLVLRADNAKIKENVTGYASVNVDVTIGGESYTVSAANGYKMGNSEWFVPESYTVLSDKAVQLNFPTSGGVTLTAVWEIDERTDPKVTVSATYQNAGNYSVIATNGKEFAPADYAAATAPFRIVEKRIPDDQSVLIEQYMSTPMAAITLNEGVVADGKTATIGVVVDGTELESEWVYQENSEFGFMVRGMRNGLQGGIMAPLMGSDYSQMAAGDTYSFAYRPIVALNGWYETYKHVATGIFDVHDYRSNYYNNLNDAIYNTTDLMLDDFYGGWDPIDMAHYNMEGRDVTSSANPVIAVQRYLLTENEEILEKRAIPTLAWSLTRKQRNFKRTTATGGNSAGYVWNPPSTIGTPPTEFTASTYGSLYEMSQGGIPVFANIAMEKETGSGYNAIYNNLTYYRYTGEQKYLDAAIKAGDAYIAATLQNEAYMSELPMWSTFINTDYFPNLGAFIDLYEATGEQRFLDAAEETGRIAVTSFWTTGIDNGKGETPYTVTADYVYNVREFMEGHNFFWHGSTQWRLGGDDGEVRASKDGKVKLPESETVPGWLPTRVGLGLEQASTFSEALNIIMASWVGDITRLSYYTGDEYFVTAARNAMVGRFGNYPGYYQNRYMVHQMKANYPYEGPDYTSVYWHHIPPFLAMIEEFLITDFWYESDTQINFPRMRQGGYAYFFSSQYGFDAGKMYDVDGLWLWNDRDIVNPDSVQLDYLPAKKDGVLAVAFMNRAETETVSAITLGSKVEGGASYTGTATLYDAAGNKSAVEVTNGVFTVSVPAKGLVTVVMNIEGVKAPSYASAEHRDGKAEMGATVAEHTRGRGYTLQLSGGNYYAYIYVTDMDAKDEATASHTDRAKSMTVTYKVNGVTNTVKRNEYPYEVLIKVDDVDAVLEYTVEVEKADGTTERLGGGTLMTAEKSQALGKTFSGTAIAGKAPSGAAATKPAMSKKLPKCDPFTIQYSYQGIGVDSFRFVTMINSIPFKCTENLLIGMTATVKMTEKATGEVQTFNTYVMGNEMRSDGNTTLLIAPTTDWPLADYDNDNAQTHTFEITLSRE